MTVAADVANTGNLFVRANLVGDPNISNPSREEWFNPAAFAVPAEYTFGNLGRDRFCSDPFWNVDLSIFRQFPIREAMRLEFRAEAFNVFNTVVYAAPDSDLTSPTFGQVFSTANNPRVLQLGAKFIFEEARLCSRKYSSGTAVAAALCIPTFAREGSLETGDIADLRLENGEVLRDCRIAYRTYGTLNTQRSNVVVFPTWLAGTI